MLYFKIFKTWHPLLYSKLTQLNAENKAKQPKEKQAKVISFFLKDIQMANRYIKKSSTTLIIREM